MGVPYPPDYEQTAFADLKLQAAKIGTNLQTGMIKAEPDKEIIAVIAYLQRLGTDIKAALVAPTVPPPQKTAQMNIPKQP